MKIHINKSNIFRGYTSIGAELTDGKYDWLECVDFGSNSKESNKKILKN